MYIPRPYPDELLGSFLHRAVRQLGLSQKRLMTTLSGINSQTLPMVITRHAGIVKACGMDHLDFMQRHTLLPYMMAFMPNQDQSRLLDAFLNPSDDSDPTSAAAQNATKTTVNLRFCQHCIKDDLQRYGDAYWRRSHQLPGVSLCISHTSKLVVSDIRVRTTQNLVPPNEARGTRTSNNILSFDVQLRIVSISVAALSGKLPRQSWQSYYRREAAKFGYGFKGGQIIGEVFSADLLEYYGHAYLELLGLNFEVGKRNTWPAIMFRDSMANSTALKHVLLNVFLASSPSPSRSPHQVLKRPKRKETNWACKEKQLIAKLTAEQKKHKPAGTRITVKELAEIVGAKQALHHHRQKVPKLNAWIERFKASPQSERQTGKRPRKY